MDEIRKIGKPLKTRNEDRDDIEVKKQIICIIYVEMLLKCWFNVFYTM